MSMPLLHNIAYCNNIMAIQCSVSMYTEEFDSKLSFRITEGAIRLVSPDLGHTLSDP